MSSESLSLVPTLLVANRDGDSNGIVRGLQSQGYFVLVARDVADALNIVRIHSRPIHVLLTDSGQEGRMLASTATKYRRKMSVVFVSGTCEPEEDSFSPDEALRTVRELITPPKLSSAGARVHAAAGYL